MEKTTPPCPVCGSPRHRQPKGRLDGYCKPCRAEKTRQRQGHTPAERTCERCGATYRGNNRANASVCPECRTHCISCGAPKNASDSHTQCGNCRAAGKICAACGSQPTYQNRRECWDCMRKSGHAGQVRDRLYNLPPGWFDHRMREQDGKCYICKRPECAVNKRTGELYPLATDHDRRCCPGNRSCGKCLRGLICRNCNVLLGMADDNPDYLEAAADYLRQWSAGITSRSPA